ncbi:ribosome maturation factor RimM [Saccharicrinis fermentans]|uniref:Ribosome maturation factor RimM n=1 Tax=Saccharicrinis fermentans DSM 9555 = JCM 21142 TaxID=869213 RepID=W7YIN3_9BACT|nr:ribosome maturation factor RimM [Saccharicrinis fermentans]GAF02399.1 ribosome maturation factor RimM [Saccharicrinis fermentans DSM 9555 = JCM 21142]
MLLKENTVQIGFIQKTHGVKGELSLALMDGFYTEDMDWEFLLLDIDHGLVPFYVESYRVKSAQSMLVKLESIDSETKASGVCGTQVYVEKSEMEEEQEFTSNAFVGYKVYDKSKAFIGEIVEVQDISNNPLFVLDYEGKEILVPINPDFIKEVDASQSMLKVDLPDGLVDLYLDEDNDELDM